jgi:hypothetical protein
VVAAAAAASGGANHDEEEEHVHKDQEQSEAATQADKCAACGKDPGTHRVKCHICNKVWHKKCADPQPGPQHLSGARTYRCIDCHGTNSANSNNNGDPNQPRKRRGRRFLSDNE